MDSSIESQELPMNYEEVFQGVEVKKVFARLQDLAIRWSMFMG